MEPTNYNSEDTHLLKLYYLSLTALGYAFVSIGCGVLVRMELHRLLCALLVGLSCTSLRTALTVPLLALFALYDIHLSAYMCTCASAETLAHRVVCRTELPHLYEPDVAVLIRAIDVCVARLSTLLARSYYVACDPAAHSTVEHIVEALCICKPMVHTMLIICRTAP
jgi:hypothetical protein